MLALWRATKGSRAAIVLGRLQGRRKSGFMANPVEFFQSVRQEASKVTWPTRRETLISTGLVIAMVVLASLFFVAVDQILRVLVGFILGLGH